MAVFMVAVRTSLAPDSVVYLIQKGGSREDAGPQEVLIQLDGHGNPVRGAAAATLSGEPLTAGAASIVGKIAHMRRVQNEWPQRAMLQA